MPIITLRIEIKAPIDVCFDLSRSIDVHVYIAQHSGEQAVAGIMSGLIGPNERVTWRAKHLWWQEMTTEIRAFDRPKHFRDSAVAGYFKRFNHDHFFERVNDATLMTDHLDFRSPLGPIGVAVDALFVRWYLMRWLGQRNRLLKEIAEDPKRRDHFLRNTNGHDSQV